jgi:L-aspartate oxidase
MAYLAGARVANLEFMQFHPTCLYHPQARNFLISEALRGEGGRLVNKAGHEFMTGVHPLGALAPRDIVARSIDAEMKKSGAECVFLDMTHHDRAYLQKRFPKIFETCLQLGIDMATDPLPVVPAAHYLCGGVLTGIHGNTDIENLFVIGESACTGLHGANRLASNSLLECLAFSHSAYTWMLENPERKAPAVDPKPWQHKKGSDQDEMILVSHMWDEIRRLMWAYVGIVRTNRRLRRAQNRMTNILSEFRDFYSEFRIHADLVELRNIAVFADLTVRCALSRHESRGIHYNLDYPTVSVQRASDTILQPSQISL